MTLLPTAVRDFNSSSFIDWTPINPVGGVYTPAPLAQEIGVACTAAGNVTLTSYNGNTLTVAVVVGFQTLIFLPASFTTTATASFFSLTALRP